MKKSQDLMSERFVFLKFGGNRQSICKEKLQSKVSAKSCVGQRVYFYFTCIDPNWPQKHDIFKLYSDKKKLPEICFMFKKRS